jgi:hypothetical protein
MTDYRSRMQEVKVKERERGFDLSMRKTNKSFIPPYNALVDPNMCHYFENRNLQSLLLRTGQIDMTGRVIELEKNKFKLTIIEKEFSRAEENEKKIRADEEDIRYRIQRKRINEIEKTRKECLLSKFRKEREFARDILSTVRPQTSIIATSSTGTRGNSRSHPSHIS